LEEMGFKDIPVGSASDGSKYGMDKINEGAVYALGINNPALIGEMACDAVIAAINGETVAGTINTPIVCVNAENYEEYKQYAY